MEKDDLEAALECVAAFEPALVDEARLIFREDLERPDTWPHERLRLVAVTESRVAGTMGYGPGAWPAKGVYWTDWLMVHPDFRRAGVGSALSLALEQQIRMLKGRLICL